MLLVSFDDMRIGKSILRCKQNVLPGVVGMNRAPEKRVPSDSRVELLQPRAVRGLSGTCRSDYYLGIIREEYLTKWHGYLLKIKHSWHP